MIWVLVSVILAAVAYIAITAIGVYREMKDFDAMLQSIRKDKSDE